MAFRDFVTSYPVITATDYDEIKIKAGEGATTDNFNRSVVDSITRDGMLETATTYVARSASIYTTSNTEFLSHCVGSGIDVIGYNAPVLQTSAEDVFLDDNTFLGAAYPARTCTNMLSYSNVDSAMSTDLGWSYEIDDGTGANVLFTTDSYCTVDNTNKADDVTPGAVTITSIPCEIVSISSSMGLISAGVSLTAKSNMITTDTQIGFGFRFLDDNENEISMEGTTVRKSSYDGTVGIESMEIPSGATKFQIILEVQYLSADSRAAFTFKNVMVQSGGLLCPYTATTRQQCTCEYENVVNPDNGNITVMNWSIFKEYSMATHSGPIGPLFIVMDNLTIGGVHQAKYGNSMTLQLMVIQNGTTTYGPEFTLPDELLGEYILSAVRIRPLEDDPETSVIDFVVVAEPEVYSSSLTVATADLGMGKFILGTDKSTTDYFNGPVTEIRYDHEWINDIELYLISLSKKPFSYKTSYDWDVGETEKTTQEILDEVGVNMLLNPTGRLAYVGWSDYPETNFMTLHNDIYAGNCFMWAGEAKSDYKILSDVINVSSNTLYSLRAVMYSDQGSSGDAGIGILWQDNDGNTVDTSEVTMAHTNQPRYSTLSIVSPVTAVKAQVYMFVRTGLYSTKLTWSRIKFEAGEPTMFTDNSGAGYALYYGVEDYGDGDGDGDGDGGGTSGTGSGSTGDIYTNVGQVGGDSSSTLAEIYELMPEGSFILLSTSDFDDKSQFPNEYGMIVICKKFKSRNCILFFGKEAQHCDYRMYLDEDSVPDGTWYLLPKAESETVGSDSKGIYIDSGTIKAQGTTVGGTAKPIYSNAGTLTAFSSTIGSSTSPVYVNAGTITACGTISTATTATKLGSSTVGSGTKPIYLNSGTATASSSTVGSGTKPVYLSSGTITASSSTVGSATKPVYLNSGTLTACTYTVNCANCDCNCDCGTDSDDGGGGGE